jgi:cysteine desulfurase
MLNPANNYSGYFDYASATPIDQYVSEYLLSIQHKSWANPNAMHSAGRDSKALLENARESVSHTLNCNSKELYFVPSATIANNLAIKGTVKNLNNIITTSTEHASIQNQLNEQSTLIETPTWENILSKIQETTELISLIWVHNELGTVINVPEIANKLAVHNTQRTQAGLHTILLHIDAVQAPNYLKIDLRNVPIDMLTLSSQKIYAPRGAAVLFVKEGVDIKPIIHGGNQESGLWSGTPNTHAICGLAVALEMVQNKIELTNKNLTLLQQDILEFVNSHPRITLLNNPQISVPGILYINVENANTEEILTYLDLQGIQVSSGSACASGATQKNSLVPEGSAGIRISMGRFTTQNDVSNLITIINNFLNQ